MTTEQLPAPTHQHLLPHQTSSRLPGRGRSISLNLAHNKESLRLFACRSSASGRLSSTTGLNKRSLAHHHRSYSRQPSALHARDGGRSQSRPSAASSQGAFSLARSARRSPVLILHPLCSLLASTRLQPRAFPLFSTNSSGACRHCSLSPRSHGISQQVAVVLPLLAYNLLQLAPGSKAPAASVAAFVSEDRKLTLRLCVGSAAWSTTRRRMI